MRKGFYHITQKVRDYLEARGDISTVHLGVDITQIDQKKQSIFPLVFILVEPATLTASITRYTFSLFFTDIVETTKGESREQFDAFFGVTDVQDVWARMGAIAEETFAEFKRGDAYEDGFQVNGDGTITPFAERFGNLLAGWELQISIDVPNGSKIC